MPRKKKAAPRSRCHPCYLHGDAHDTDPSLFWSCGDGKFHHAAWFASERYELTHQQLYDLSVVVREEQRDGGPRLPTERFLSGAGEVGLGRGVPWKLHR